MKSSMNVLINMLFCNDPNLPADCPTSQSATRIGIVEYDHTIKQVLPLDNRRETVRNFVNSLTATGLTDGGWGAERGEEMIMNAPALPSGDPAPAVKAVVFLTDGGNNHYRGARDAGPQSNTAFSAACTRMKSAGITVYTIGYALSSMAAAGFDAPLQLLRNCASGTTAAEKQDYFFDAPDGPALEEAFRSIAESVTRVRIVR